MEQPSCWEPSYVFTILSPLGAEAKQIHMLNIYFIYYSWLKIVIEMWRMLFFALNHAKTNCSPTTFLRKVEQPTEKNGAEFRIKPQLPWGPKHNLIKSLFFFPLLSYGGGASMQHWQLIGLGRARSSFVSIVWGLPERNRTINVPQDGQ